MRYFIVLLFLLLTMFISCRQEMNKQNLMQMVVIEDFVDNEFDVDECFSDINLLLLKMDTSQFIGKVKDVCIIGDTIFLLDEMTAFIYAFDKNDGRFIKAICKQGSGPNEYINPVALSVRSGSLYVLDMPTSRIIEFDNELNAMRSVRFNFPSSDFIALDTGFLLYNLTPTEEINKFVYIDNKGEYVNSFIPYEKNNYSNNMIGGLGKFFQKNEKGDVFVFESYKDTVYKWENESLIPIYQFDFGKLAMPSDIDRNEVNIFEEPYAFLSNTFVMSDMLIPSFFYKSQRFYGFISLSENLRVAGVVNDKHYHIPFFPQWQQDNQLIGICRYESAQKYFEKNQKTKKEITYDEFESEQPVLIFYTKHSRGGRKKDYN